MVKDESSRSWTHDLPKRVHDDESDYLHRMAYFRLLEGDLSKLAALFRTKHSGLDRLLARILVDMLEGNDDAEFHLKLVPNPKMISRKSQSSGNRFKKYIAQRALGRAVLRAGALTGDESAVKVAIGKVASENGVGDETVRKAWLALRKETRDLMFAAALHRYCGGWEQAEDLQEKVENGAPLPSDFVFAPSEDEIKRALENSAKHDFS